MRDLAQRQCPGRLRTELVLDRTPKAGVAGSNPAGAQYKGPAQDGFLPGWLFAVFGAVPFACDHVRAASLPPLPEGSSPTIADHGVEAVGDGTIAFAGVS